MKKLTKEERRELACKRYEEIQKPAWKRFEKECKEIDAEPNEICEKCGQEIK